MQLILELFSMVSIKDISYSCTLFSSHKFHKWQHTSDPLPASPVTLIPSIPRKALCRSPLAQPVVCSHPYPGHSHLWEERGCWGALAKRPPPWGSGPRHSLVACKFTGIQSKLPALLSAPKRPEPAAPCSSAEDAGCMVLALQMGRTLARGSSSSTPRPGSSISSISGTTLPPSDKLLKRDPHFMSSLQHFSNIT